MSRGVGVFIPYTGSVLPSILEWREGFSRVQLKDRRRVRNHLDSIHAVALMNVGEFSTGLAVVSRLPKTHRMILTHFEIDYTKKARGDVIAEAEFEGSDFTVEQGYPVVSRIKDSKGEVVATAKATWRVGPIRSKAGRA